MFKALYLTPSEIRKCWEKGIYPRIAGTTVRYVEVTVPPFPLVTFTHGQHTFIRGMTISTGMLRLRRKVTLSIDVGPQFSFDGGMPCSSLSDAFAKLTITGRQDPEVYFPVTKWALQSLATGVGERKIHCLFETLPTFLCDPPAPLPVSLCEPPVPGDLVEVEYEGKGYPAIVYRIRKDTCDVYYTMEDKVEWDLPVQHITRKREPVHLVEKHMAEMFRRGEFTLIKED